LTISNLAGRASWNLSYLRRSSIVKTSASQL
jgi:hypothetical protein